MGDIDIVIEKTEAAGLTLDAATVKADLERVMKIVDGIDKVIPSQTVHNVIHVMDSVVTQDWFIEIIVMAASLVKSGASQDEVKKAVAAKMAA